MAKRKRKAAPTTWHGNGVFSRTRVSDGKEVFYIQYRYQGKRITEKVGLQLDRALGRAEARREALEDPAYIPQSISSSWPSFCVVFGFKYKLQEDRA